MHTTKQNLYNGKGSLKLIWTLLVAIAGIGALALVSCPDDPDDDSSGKLDITSSETADLKWGDTVTYTLTEDGEPVTTDIEWSVTRDSVAAAEVPAVTENETLNLSDLITQDNGELIIDYRFITDAKVTGTIPYVIAAVYGAKTVTYTTNLKGIYIDITMVAKDANSFTLDLKPVPFVSLVKEAVVTGVLAEVRLGLWSTEGTSNILANTKGTDGANQTSSNPNANPKSEDGVLSAIVEDTFLGTLDTGALARVKISNTDGSDLTDTVVVSFTMWSVAGHSLTRDIKVEFHLSAISIGQSASFAMGSAPENKTAVFNAETSGYVVAP